MQSRNTGLSRADCTLTVLVMISFAFLHPGTLFAADYSFSTDITRLNITEYPTIDIYFSVKNSQDEPIVGLADSDVQLYLDEREQRFFQVIPLRDMNKRMSVIMLLQTANVMVGDPFFQGKKVVREVAGRLAPQDAFALAVFHSNFEVVMELSDEKFRVPRLLQKLQLHSGNYSLNNALAQALLLWENELQGDSTLVFIAHDQVVSSLDVEYRLRERLRLLNKPVIGMIAGKYGASPRSRRWAKEMGITLLPLSGGEGRNILQKVDTQSPGLYQLRIVVDENPDFKPHRIKLVVSLFGSRSEDQVSFISAPGTGINPVSLSENYFSYHWAFLFFFICIGVGITGFSLFVLELFFSRTISLLLHITMLVIGGVTGGIIALVLRSLPG